MATIVRKLPFGLAEILPPSLVGFAVINGFTFAVDLGVLTTLRSGLRWLVFRDVQRPARRASPS